MTQIFLVSASFFLFQSAFAAVHSVENISEKAKGDRLSLADVNSILGTIRGFFFDDSTGFVGIGTDSPSAKLEIKSNNGSNGIMIQNEGNDSWLKLKTNSENWVISNDGNDNFNNGSLVFSSDDGQDFRMIIENTGNIGIGTPYPSTKLEVSAGSDVLANVVNDSLLKINQAFPGGGAEADYKDAAITLGVSTPHAKIAAGATFLDNRPGHLSFFTRNSTSSSLEEALRIDSNGRVGIGTVAPNATLDVRSGEKTATNTLASFSTAEDENPQLLYIQNIENTGMLIQATETSVSNNNLLLNRHGGNVGIGTASPEAKLEVAGEILQTSRSRNGYIYAQGSDTEKKYHYLGRISSWCGSLKVDGSFESHDTNTERGTGSFSLNFARRNGLRVNGFASGMFGKSLDIELYETQEGILADGSDGHEAAYGKNLNVYLVTGTYAMTNINISHAPHCGKGGEINTAEITPQPKSETNHDGETPYYQLSTDGAPLFTDVNGNVGIGTTVPEAKLEVAGDIKHSGQYSVKGSFTVPIDEVNHTMQTRTEVIDLHSLLGTSAGVYRVVVTTNDVGNGVAVKSALVHVFEEYNIRPFVSEETGMNYSVGNLTVEIQPFNGINSSDHHPDDGGKFQIYATVDGAAGVNAGEDAVITWSATRIGH